MNHFNSRPAMRLPVSLPEFVSPKQLARAIGVSESSVKRWCDQGLLETGRTAGGHRRLQLPQVLDFLRARQFAVVDPAVLGLPAACGQGERTADRARERLLAALIEGDDLRSRQILFDLYLAGRSILELCDALLTPVLHEIGARWDCGSLAVYQERRACEAVIRVLHELRLLLAEPPPDAPTAIGGTGPDDFYSVPTTMVELIFRAGGWRANSLGSGLPFDTLVQAIEHVRPQLFWLSVTHLGPADRFVEGFTRLSNAAAALKVPFVVGGQALSEEIRGRLRFTAFCDTLGHLDATSRALRETLGLAKMPMEHSTPAVARPIAAPDGSS